MVWKVSFNSWKCVWASCILMFSSVPPTFSTYNPNCLQQTSINSWRGLTEWRVEPWKNQEIHMNSMHCVNSAGSLPDLTQHPQCWSSDMVEPCSLIGQPCPVCRWCTVWHPVTLLQTPRGLLIIHGFGWWGVVPPLHSVLSH